MDVISLEILVETAKLGSFAAVARKHDRDPSSISRVIAALEDQLQLRLFKRSTRKLSLTEAGERYLARVEPLLAELASAEAEAKSLNQAPSGTLRITASVAFGQTCLLAHLKEFCDMYPKLTLDIRLTDTNIDLLTEDIDIACRLTPGFDSGLVGVKLFDTRYHVCASPEYIKNSPRIKAPASLTKHKCLVFNLPHYRSRWLFKNLKNQLSEVKIASNISISSALALHECAIRGMGPTLLADWLIRENLRDGSLIDLFPDYNVTATDFETAAWLLYPSRKYLPSKTRLMIDFLRKKFRNRTAA